jgi:hypothetical protein
MSDPSKLYDNLPDCYSRDPSRDSYKFLSGLAQALSAGQQAIEDFCDDTDVELADGTGLDVAGENLAAERPPGLTDPQYLILIQVYAPCKRTTIQAIRSVFEAASLSVSVTVQDKQLNGAIPVFEVWIYVDILSWDVGAYAGMDAQYPNPPLSIGWPVPSCLAGKDSQVNGLVYEGTGVYGGKYNDHWWSYADWWTMQYVDKVKLAGTTVIYKLKP